MEDGSIVAHERDTVTWVDAATTEPALLYSHLDAPPTSSRQGGETTFGASELRIHFVGRIRPAV